MEHQKYMRRCQELGRRAGELGESPVGSLVVLDGEVIAEGMEMSRQLGDISRHAEMVALLSARQKVEDLSRAILYSNVEPCLLCTYAIRHYRIREVVYLKPAGVLGGAGGAFPVLTSPVAGAWGDPPTVTQLAAEDMDL